LPEEFNAFVDARVTDHGPLDIETMIAEAKTSLIERRTRS
jgi:hypothetical protein